MSEKQIAERMAQLPEEYQALILATLRGMEMANEASKTAQETPQRITKARRRAGGYMSKKILKKDILKRLESVEKWQHDYATAQQKRLEAEITRLKRQVDFPPIPLFGDLQKPRKPNGGIM